MLCFISRQFIIIYAFMFTFPEELTYLGKWPEAVWQESTVGKCNFFQQKALFAKPSGILATML